MKLTANYSRFLALIFIFWMFPGESSATVIQGMRFWQSPESTRIVFDLSSPAEYNLFTLENPRRLVIDLPESSLGIDLETLTIDSTWISKVRTSRPTEQNALRIVLELKEDVEPKSFVLKPFQQYGDRLVIDLNQKSAAKVVEEPAPPVNLNRDIVVAIDAGHGGEDPGALGGRGTKEKAVTLEVSKRLAKMINAEKGMKAVLTRKGDYYVDHRKRTQIARDHRADLFVSIHADGFHDPKANGSSVWVLSPRGAKSEMGLWLEKREQASDLLGGVDNTLSLSDKDPTLAEVLLQLSMDYSIGASLDVAEQVLRKLKPVVPRLHNNTVQRAGFLVLKNPDIPSILVETAYISNPKEEKLLLTRSHQEKLSRAVRDGIKEYFRKNPPDGTYFASVYKVNRYKIRSGDTLSEIAMRFDIPVSHLKATNKLKTDVLYIGQELIIPVPK